MLHIKYFFKRKLALMLIALFFSVILIPSISFSATVPLIINSGSSAPLTIDNSHGFYPELVQTLFDRLNADILIRHTQSASSLKNVNQGRDDGVIARIKGLNKKLTNLIPVTEKVITLEFNAFSNDKNIKIKTWDDLKNYNIAYIKGWKIFDKNIKSYESLIKAKNTTQLFGLLKKKRVDIILTQKIIGKYTMKQMNYSPLIHPPLATRDMYIYMHKKNSNLVPKIASELKKMKKDGTYQKLYDKNIN